MATERTHVSSTADRGRVVSAEAEAARIRGVRWDDGACVCFTVGLTALVVYSTCRVLGHRQTLDDLASHGPRERFSFPDRVAVVLRSVIDAQPTQAVLDHRNLVAATAAAIAFGGYVLLAGRVFKTRIPTTFAGAVVASIFVLIFAEGVQVPPTGNGLGTCHALRSAFSRMAKPTGSEVQAFHHLRCHLPRRSAGQVATTPLPTAQ